MKLAFFAVCVGLSALAVLAMGCSSVPLQDSPKVSRVVVVPRPAAFKRAAKEQGPSRERLVVLLRECREANREHLRMLKEYDAARCSARPEQAHGAVEFDLGGY